jgi:hypothetical protein
MTGTGVTASGVTGGGVTGGDVLPVVIGVWAATIATAPPTAGSSPLFPPPPQPPRSMVEDSDSSIKASMGVRWALGNFEKNIYRPQHTQRLPTAAVNQRRPNFVFFFRKNFVLMCATAR